MKYNQKICIVLLYLTIIIKSDYVCDERLLKLELRQDIEDNGMLDCLRVVEAPHSYLETEDEKNKRIASQWDTECAFEAEYNWMEQLKNVHGIQNLVDVSGEIVEKDFENQADMCEIIRAAIAGGKMQKITSDVQGIPLSILEEIDCYGNEKQSEICAKGWTILLQGMSLSINKKQKWNKLDFSADSKNSADDEEDKEMQKKLDQTKSSKVVEDGIEPEQKLLFMWMGFDSKYKTDRPPCVDFKTTDKLAAVKGMELKVDKVSQMNVLMIHNMVGMMKSQKDKKKGGHIQGVITVKDKEMKSSRFEVGMGKNFQVQTGYSMEVKGKEDLKIQLKVGGDADVQCDIEGDNNSMFLIGVNSTMYKMEQRKVENEFKYSLKEKVESVSGQEGGKNQKQEQKKTGGEESGVIDKLTIVKKYETESQWVLLQYSIGVAVDASIMNQIIIDQESLPISRCINSNNASEITTHNHGLALFKLTEQVEHTIQLAYNLKPVKTKLDQKSNPYSSALFNLIELPSDIKVEEKTISQDLTLSSKQWTSIDDLSISFRNEEPKNILIIYNIMVEYEEPGQVLQARLMLNEKEIIMGRSKSSDYNIVSEKQSLLLSSYLSLRGQAVITLKNKNPSNRISLEYRINKGTVSIPKEAANFETINIQILQAHVLELTDEQKEKEEIKKS